MLQSFLSRLHRDPAAKTTVKSLHDSFLAGLTPREATIWPKWRFIQELEAAGLLLGKDTNDVLCAAGVSLVQPPQWVRDESGRLVKV